MTATLETAGFAEELDGAALAAAAHEVAPPAIPEPVRRGSRKSVLAFAICALAINGTAAVYTSPAELPSLDVGHLAAMLPRFEASEPKPDPVIAALKDIQAAQQQHTALLQQTNQASDQNSLLLQQDSMLLLSLRSSITEERVDVRKISSQLSSLMAKIDSLQNTITSDVTSSIRKANARFGLPPTVRKRVTREPQALGPVSVGGAPLTVPAAVAEPDS